MDWNDIVLPANIEALPGKNALEKIHTYYKPYDDEQDFGVGVYKIEFDTNNFVSDLRLVYSNPKHEDMLGLSNSEIVGHMSGEFLTSLSVKWLTIGYEAAYVGKKFDETIYSTIFKKFMRYTAQRAFAPGYVFITFKTFSDVSDLDKLIHKRWRTDEIIVTISQVLRSTGDIETLMYRSLQEIAFNIKPTNLYIVEHLENRRECLYEWCAPGMPSVKKIVKELPVGTAQKAWHQLVDGGSGYAVHDIEALHDHDPVLYDFYASRHVKSLVLAPFAHQGEIIGALIAENPVPNDEINGKRLLEMAAFFFGAELRANRMLHKLHYVSRHDLLTRIYNRNAMEQDVEKLRKQSEPIGLVFADLNGMKLINDEQGHAAGDLLLKRTARLLELLFGENSAYRIGGDEFLVLTTAYTDTDFKERVRMLDVQSTVLGISVSVGSRYIKDPAKLDEEMREADREMYAVKHAYYERFPQKKRR